MAEMLKRKDFLENEVVDLRDEIALVSPTDTPLTNDLTFCYMLYRARSYPCIPVNVICEPSQLHAQTLT